jgi:hypothetical protein
LQNTVEKTLLANKHPVEGKKGRNCRQRPGQNIDDQQGLDPPPAAHEEAGQQQGQKHFHVHAEADEEQGIDHGPRVVRV